MTLYLDTNVFYNAYCPIEDASLVDWLFDQLHPDFPAITSEWCLIEIFRAFKKQMNLGAITKKDAEIALDYFLSDIGEMVKNKTLLLVPVTQALIIASRDLIFTCNLYAADALHATTALKLESRAFITFDSDFNVPLGNIPILNPSITNFKSEIAKCKSK
ncbi:MAG: type II toxin-antitoxin system VapC family toxin [Asgard group archaeon]|nr:type II toxin-antitoxin system VapC family toxin [Asgard group archaeon]